MVNLKKLPNVCEVYEAILDGTGSWPYSVVVFTD